MRQTAGGKLDFTSGFFGERRALLSNKHGHCEVCNVRFGEIRNQQSRFGRSEIRKSVVLLIYVFLINLLSVPRCLKGLMANNL